jgi:hypothetical protein
MRARIGVGFVAAAVAAASVIVSALPAGANLPGAIFSTDAACGGTVDLFDAKADVHLGGNGLPDASYFAKVTTPGGATLGQSAGADVHVTNGALDECYSISALTTFNDTPSDDGEYKLWLSPDPAFPAALSMVDNFRVLAEPALAVPSVTTHVVDDRTGADITNQVVSVVEGDTFTVRDVADVAGAGATPTGDLTFDLYANGVCDPQGEIIGSETVVIDAGAASSGTSAAIPLGDPVVIEYSYQASYWGDDAHLTARAECEPFFVAIVAGEAAAVDDPGVAGAPTELAFTGGARAWLAALGFVLVAGGAALLVLSRRRERLDVRA